jgi:hypothetical protein
MKYTLITSKGKVLVFNILACAETFQQAYGGTLITDQMYSSIYAELLVDNNSQNVYNSSIEQQGV